MLVTILSFNTTANYAQENIYVKMNSNSKLYPLI